VSDVSDQRKYYERMMDEIAIEHRRQVDQLQAENAALRTQLADVTESMGRVEERCAKLRKLVADICSCARDNPCSRCYFVSGKCEFCDRMRELGVEVGE
jgi:prefoldin subunit 5